MEIFILKTFVSDTESQVYGIVMHNSKKDLNKLFNAATEIRDTYEEFQNSIYMFENQENIVFVDYMNLHKFLSNTIKSKKSLQKHMREINFADLLGENYKFTTDTIDNLLQDDMDVLYEKGFVYLHDFPEYTGTSIPTAVVKMFITASTVYWETIFDKSDLSVITTHIPDSYFIN